MPSFSDAELGVMFAKKLCVTLGDLFSSTCRVSSLWFSELKQFLEYCSVFVRVCWLKTVAGGWTTTVRMHEDIRWSCLFGCCCAPDSLQHYLVCPILWLIVVGVFPDEVSISIAERLCLVNPSMLKLRRLALAHGIYHACKNDPSCIVDGLPACPLIVQNRAFEHSQALRHVIR